MNFLYFGYFLVLNLHIAIFDIWDVCYSKWFGSDFSIISLCECILILRGLMQHPEELDMDPFFIIRIGSGGDCESCVEPTNSNF